MAARDARPGRSRSDSRRRSPSSDHPTGAGGGDFRQRAGDLERQEWKKSAALAQRFGKDAVTQAPSGQEPGAAASDVLPEAEASAVLRRRAGLSAEKAAQLREAPIKRDDAVKRIAEILSHKFFLQPHPRFRRRISGEESWVDARGTHVHQILMKPSIRMRFGWRLRQVDWERRASNRLHVQALAHWATILAESRDEETLEASRLLCKHVRKHFYPNWLLFDESMVITRLLELPDIPTSKRIELQGDLARVRQAQDNSIIDEIEVDPGNEWVLRTLVDNRIGQEAELSPEGDEKGARRRKDRQLLRSALEGGNWSSSFLVELSHKLGALGDGKSATQALEIAGTHTTDPELLWEIGQELERFEEWDEALRAV